MCKKSGGGTNLSTAPEIATVSVTNITSATALCHGTVGQMPNNATSVSCGVCWDTKPHPTIALITTAQTTVSSIGDFTCALTGLSGGITYYVRSTMLNSQGERLYGNEISFTTTPSTIAIGQSYAGGIIFYIDNTKLHGLLVSPIDQLAAPWDNGNYTANAFTTSTALGTGRANTTTIINTLGPSTSYTGYAALTASSLSINGYSDWYLPSKDEVSLMMMNLSTLDLGSSNLSSGYWSSSTDSDISFFAWQLAGIDNSFSLIMMDRLGAVRAVRSF